jgi:gamma-glutamyltranspeptidase/glutathione hydrolase
MGRPLSWAADRPAHRPLIMGRRGAVAANHPLAAQAGLQALRAGGGAADAAVATALALAVVEPAMSGLGGDGFYHVFDGASGRSEVINATGPAPAAATLERYRDGIPLAGPLAVSVPGMLAGLGMLHRRAGRLAWADCAREAIALAEGGFAATHAHRALVEEAGGDVPQLGAFVVNRELARTLEEVAGEGAETFYRGPLGRRLAEALADAGSLVSAADLEAFEPELQAPIAVDYRGFTVLQAPPNSVGFVLLEELAIAECFDLAGMGLLSADAVHVLVEAKKLAFADRERWGADPRTLQAPLQELLSADYAAAQAARIDLQRAAPAAPTLTTSGQTTYFAVVDGEGNAVSGIQSINGAFGSGVVAGDTGVLMNNRMAYWHVEPGHPNQLRPGRRVRHTMNPPIVLRDGALWGVFGTPGADVQVQVNLQVLTAMIDFGLDPQQAAELPRWSSSAPGQYADYPHEIEEALEIESGVPQEVRDELARRGHPVRTIGDLEGPCNVEIIRRDPASGLLAAASDPRNDGWAAAW